MVNKSGKVGTATETAVVRVLRARGWPNAERRRLRGRHDPGDITGTPGLAWSVKGGDAARRAPDLQVKLWLEQAERMRVNTDADVAVLVLARAGIGAANAHRWWAVLPLNMTVVLRLPPARIIAPGPLCAGPPIRLHLADCCDLLNAAGYGGRAVA